MDCWHRHQTSRNERYATCSQAFSTRTSTISSSIGKPDGRTVCTCGMKFKRKGFQEGGYNPVDAAEAGYSSGDHAEEIAHGQPDTAGPRFDNWRNRLRERWCWQVRRWRSMGILVQCMGRSPVAGGRPGDYWKREMYREAVGRPHP